MRYLQSIEGKAWLAGQEENNFSTTSQKDKIRSITGKLPALRGFDIRADSVDPTDEAIRWWTEHGGLVTFSYHMGAPPNEDSYTNSKGQTSIDKVLRPGSREHKDFVAKLDTVAVRLQRMKEAGLPILWRPWHEMNGTWFWWSKEGPEAFKRLWVFTHDYYTRKKGLDNLIWVWSASYEPKRDWYPGDRYVDIVGSDVYLEKPDPKRWLAICRGLKTIAPSKQAALTENDVIPHPDDLSRTGNRFVWFLTWHSQWLDENSREHLRQVYSHKYTITADELPDFRTGQTSPR